MLQYWFNCLKNAERENLKVVMKKKMEEQCFYQNLQCMTVKYKDLSKSQWIIQQFSNKDSLT